MKRESDAFKSFLVNGKEVKLFDLAKYRGNILKEVDGHLEVMYEDVILIYNISTDDFLIDNLGSKNAFVLANDMDKFSDEENNYYFMKLDEYRFPYRNYSSNKGYVDVDSLKLVSRSQFEGQYIDDEIQTRPENLPSKKR